MFSPETLRNIPQEWRIPAGPRREIGQRLNRAVIGTIDDEMVKLPDLEHVTCIAVTHQIRDAFHVAAHEAVRTGDRVRITPGDETKTGRATFRVLHDGQIQFEGRAAALRASNNAYLKDLLFMTLPPW